VWEWTKTQFELEINSSADNPLVDLQSGELFTSSSMVSLLPALAMDSLRQALAKVSVQSMERRALKLQSPPFTGLPVGPRRRGCRRWRHPLAQFELHRLGPNGFAAGPRPAPVILHYVGHTADGGRGCDQSAAAVGKRKPGRSSIGPGRRRRSKMAIAVWGDGSPPSGARGLRHWASPGVRTAAAAVAHRRGRGTDLQHAATSSLRSVMGDFVGDCLSAAAE